MGGFVGFGRSFKGSKVFHYGLNPQFKEEDNINAKNLIGDRKTIRSFQFCIAISSIISSLLLFLMLFHQYLIKYKRELLGGGGGSELYKATISTFQPTIFHPEIFIPQSIILLLLGSILIYLLKLQVRNDTERNSYDTIIKYLTIINAIFCGVFILGLIFGYSIYGTYGIVHPLLGIVLVIIVSLGSLLIVVLTKRMRNYVENPEEFPNKAKKLIDYKLLDFRVITAFLILLVFVSTWPVFFIHTSTIQYIYWENESYQNIYVFPGTNVSYNLTVVSQDGPDTLTYYIVEIENRTTGNWEVNPRKVVVRPNEKKNITFTNFVPLNATIGTQYTFRFYLINSDDSGIGSGGSESIGTQVTLNRNLINASQNTSSEESPRFNRYFNAPSSFKEVMIRFSFLSILAYLVILGFFEWNEFIIKRQNKRSYLR